MSTSLCYLLPFLGIYHFHYTFYCVQAYRLYLDYAVCDIHYY
jgi:hypothetical protein